MPRLIILPAARADIFEIADHIALDNPSRAQAFVAELEARMRVAPSSGARSKARCSPAAWNRAGGSVTLSA